MRSFIGTLSIVVLCGLALAGVSFASSSGEDWDEEILVILPEEFNTPASPAPGDAGIGDSGGTASGHEGMTPAMPGGKMGPGQGPRPPWLTTYLNLTPDQVSKLRDIRNSYLMDTRDLRYDMSIRHIEMMRLFTDPKASESALAEKIKQLSDLRQKMMDRKARMIIQIRSIFTPEQLMKFGILPLRGPMGGRGMQHGMMGGGMMGGMGGGRMTCP